jgi:hypothetical protein
MPETVPVGHGVSCWAVKKSIATCWIDSGCARMDSWIPWDNSRRHCIVPFLTIKTVTRIRRKTPVVSVEGGLPRIQ